MSVRGTVGVSVGIAVGRTAGVPVGKGATVEGSVFVGISVTVEEGAGRSGIPVGCEQADKEQKNTKIRKKMG